MSVFGIAPEGNRLTQSPTGEYNRGTLRTDGSETVKVGDRFLQSIGCGPDQLFTYERRFRAKLEARGAFSAKMREIQMRRGDKAVDLWCASWADNRIGISVFLILFLAISLVDRFSGPWGWVALPLACPFEGLAFVRASQSKRIGN